MHYDDFYRFAYLCYVNYSLSSLTPQQRWSALDLTAWAWKSNGASVQFHHWLVIHGIKQYNIVNMAVFLETIYHNESIMLKILINDIDIMLWCKTLNLDYNTVICQNHFVKEDGNG